MKTANASGKLSKANSKEMGNVFSEFASELRKAKSLKKGLIVFRLKGAQGGDFIFDCSDKSVKLSKDPPRAIPLIEIEGDFKRIKGILQGKKDGRAQFLAGGILIRGDIRYLSDLAMELKIIREPI